MHICSSPAVEAGVFPHLINCLNYTRTAENRKIFLRFPVKCEVFIFIFI